MIGSRVPAARPEGSPRVVSGPLRLRVRKLDEEMKKKKKKKKA